MKSVRVSVLVAGLLAAGAAPLAAEGVPAQRDWREEINAKLQKNVDLEFVETPFGEVLGVLIRLGEVPVIVDPEASINQPAITLRLTQTKLALALKWVLRMVKMDYDLRPGAVYVSTPDGASGWPKEVKPSEAPGADERRLDELIAAYCQPVQSVEPSAEQKARIAQLIADLGADDFAKREAASAAAAKLGGEALEAMRRAAASSDLEVAERARAATTAIENGAKTAVVEALRKMADPKQLLKRKLAEAAGAWAVKAKAYLEAEKAGRDQELSGLLDAAGAAAKRYAAVRTLAGVLSKPAAGPEGK